MKVQLRNLYGARCRAYGGAVTAPAPALVYRNGRSPEGICAAEQAEGYRTVTRHAIKGKQHGLETAYRGTQPWRIREENMKFVKNDNSALTNKMLNYRYTGTGGIMEWQSIAKKIKSGC